MALLTALNLFVLIALSILGLALCVDMRGQRKALAALTAATKRGHGDPCPTGAPVAQGEPASGPREASAVQLVHARTALRVLEPAARRVVTVTRDDAPIHTRSTVAESASEPAQIIAKIEALAPPVRPPAPSSNMTLPERAARRHDELTQAAGGVAVHCKVGAGCTAPRFVCCACLCAPCALVRALLSRAQRDVGMVEIQRMPGERREAWEARAADARGTGEGDRSALFGLGPNDRPTPEGEPDPSDATCVFSNDPGAADAQIPGVPVLARADAPRAAPPDVAQALGADPGRPMVGLSVDEADAAQEPLLDVPLRRTTLTEHPSEPPPAGVRSVPHPPAETAEARATWGTTRQRIPRPDVKLRGKARPPLYVEPEEEALARIDALAERFGVTREAMFARVMERGFDAEEHRSRAAGPTTPPEGPANDVPTPSHKPGT